MVSSATSTFQTGIAAMRQGRYADAIPLLETGCQQVSPQSDAYATSAKVLIHAYEAVGDLEAALGLCRRLAEHPNAAIRHWSYQKRPALEKQQPIPGQVTQFLTLDAQANALEPDQTAFQIRDGATAAAHPIDSRQRDAGLKALNRQQYGLAVKHLEAHLKQIQFANGKPHTHIALARAYCGDRQTRAARDLCNHLTQSQDPGTQRWAQQFLAAMASHPRAQDPLAAERAARDRSHTFRWDISHKLIVIALHLSIYGGLMLLPLLPAALGQQLFRALVHQGSLTPELLQPLAIAFLPVLFPLGLCYLSKDKLLQAQGREVVNYWLTLAAIALTTTLGGNIILQVTALLAQVPLLFNLAQGFVTVASLSYGLSPLGAIAWFLAKPDRLFRYPFILRLF